MAGARPSVALARSVPRAFISLFICLSLSVFLRLLSVRFSAFAFVSPSLSFPLRSAPPRPFPPSLAPSLPVPHASPPLCLYLSLSPTLPRPLSLQPLSDLCKFVVANPKQSRWPPLLTLPRSLVVAASRCLSVRHSFLSPCLSSRVSFVCLFVVFSSGSFVSRFLPVFFYRCYLCYLSLCLVRIFFLFVISFSG